MNCEFSRIKNFFICPLWRLRHKLGTCKRPFIIYDQNACNTVHSIQVTSKSPSVKEYFYMTKTGFKLV